MSRKTYFLHTRNKRHTRSKKSRRISKRSRSSLYKHLSKKNKVRRQHGGGYEYRIPDEAVVGYKTDEGVEVFKTMSEIRKEKENGLL